MTLYDKRGQKRLYKRIEKSFIVSLRDTNDPQAKKEIAQIKNISMGGICLIRSNPYPLPTNLEIEIKVPHSQKLIRLQGTIKGIVEKVPNVIYEIRIQFDYLTLEAESIIAQIVGAQQGNEKTMERRKSRRISKNLIVSYYNKTNPTIKQSVSQIKNISLGGICLITSQYFPPSTILIINMRIPYLTGEIQMEGKVIECFEQIPKILYETRLEFQQLVPKSILMLKKILEYYYSTEE